jgi:hypothetical protein
MEKRPLSHSSYLPLIFSLMVISLTLGCSGSFNSSNVASTLENVTFPNGTQILGDPSDSIAIQAMVQDSSGNIYIAGNASQSFEGQALTGTQDLLIVKYDSTNTVQWTKLLGTASGTMSICGLTTDGTNIFVTGFTDSDLNGQTITGTNDMFVVELDNTGAVQWTRLLGVAGATTNATSIVYDGSHLDITGVTTGNLDGQSLTGTQDLFLTQYDTSGNKQWTKMLGVAGVATVGKSITFDGTNIYISGYTSGNLDGQSLTGTQDLFLTQYDTSGNKQWTKLLGSTGNGTEPYATYSKADASAIYVVGDVINSAGGTFDGQTLTSGVDNLFITKYDSTGTKQWTRTLNGSSMTSGRAITVDSGGNPIVGGNANGDVDGQTITGTRDILMVKYNSAGTKQWTYLSGSLNEIFIPSAMCIDGSNAIVTSGNILLQGLYNGQNYNGNSSGFLMTYPP